MIFFRFLIFLLCSHVVTVANADITVTVKEEVSVLHSTYTLGDIAAINGTEKFSILNELPLGQSAKMGQFINVPIENIKTRVFKLVPGVANTIDWHGAKVVKINSKGRGVPLGDVKKITSTALNQWLSRYYKSYEYRLIKSARDIIVPLGEITFKTSIKTPKKALKRMVVWLDVYIDNIFYQSYRFWYQVSAKQETLVAKNRIETKTPLNIDLFTIDYIDVTTFSGNPVTEYKKLDSRRAVKVIEKGTALTYNMLEKIPFVTKGQLINVYVRQHNVGISTKAIALKSGNINEKIPMLNPATKGKYMGTIVGEKQVVVE
ncbi:hypothetical protein IMCC1989_1992 [gamma proteobacterium IMCC1989]|nr:hypothetical protein IMCC1989_1992 [gamma proteobacterium IMCC1989]